MFSWRPTLIACVLTVLLGCGQTLLELSSDPANRPEIQPLRRDVDAIWVTDEDVEAPNRPVATLCTRPLRREVLETEGINELRTQAHRVGAHAVIRVQAQPRLTEEIAYRPGNLTLMGTQWVTLYQLTGLAVVFEDPSPDPWPAHFDLNIPPEN